MRAFIYIGFVLAALMAIETPRAFADGDHGSNAAGAAGTDLAPLYANLKTLETQKKELDDKLATEEKKEPKNQGTIDDLKGQITKKENEILKQKLDIAGKEAAAAKNAATSQHAKQGESGKAIPPPAPPSAPPEKKKSEESKPNPTPNPTPAALTTPFKAPAETAAKPVTTSQPRAVVSTEMPTKASPEAEAKAQSILAEAEADIVDTTIPTTPVARQSITVTKPGATPTSKAGTTSNVGLGNAMVAKPTTVAAKTTARMGVTSTQSVGKTTQAAVQEESALIVSLKTAQTKKAVTSKKTVGGSTSLMASATRAVASNVTVPRTLVAQMNTARGMISGSTAKVRQVAAAPLEIAKPKSVGVAHDMSPRGQASSPYQGTTHK